MCACEWRTINTWTNIRRTCGVRACVQCARPLVQAVCGMEWRARVPCWCAVALVGGVGGGDSSTIHLHIYRNINDHDTQCTRTKQTHQLNRTYVWVRAWVCMCPNHASYARMYYCQCEIRLVCSGVCIVYCPRNQVRWPGNLDFGINGWVIRLTHILETGGFMECGIRSMKFQHCIDEQKSVNTWFVFFIGLWCLVFTYSVIFLCSMYNLMENLLKHIVWNQFIVAIVWIASTQVFLSVSSNHLKPNTFFVDSTLVICVCPNIVRQILCTPIISL